MKDNKKMKGTKQFSTGSATDYTQESSKEFGATVPTGYVSPEKMAKEAYPQGSKKQNTKSTNYSQEAASELDVNKVMKAGKENTKKNKQ